MNTRNSTYSAPAGRWALVDVFIPEALRHIDQRDILYKARALVLVHAMTLLTLERLWREIQLYQAELGELKVILPVIVTIGAIILASLAVFKRLGSFAIAAHLYGATSICTILSVISLSGGFLVSPAMPWWPILIALIFIMGGWSTAFIWAVVSLLIFLAGMNFETGWTINLFTPEFQREAYVYSVILCGFHMMAALRFLEFCQRQLLHRAKVERDRALFSAAHDPLTGLANRKTFQLRVAGIAQRQEEAEEIQAVLMIDLDDFKLVNDEFGHQAGDQVLIAIARRLRAQTRPDDLAARLGGDEFAVLLSGMTSDFDAETVAMKLHHAITSPISLENGHNISVGASIGIAIAPCDGDAVDTLLHHADMAMYEAKTCGHAYLLHSSDRRNRKQERLPSSLQTQKQPCLIQPDRPTGTV